MDFLPAVAAPTAAQIPFKISCMRCEGRNSKNGEIGMFANRFSLAWMGFLSTHLHKNSQIDDKLLES
jgi:hypothetical protein